MTSARARLFSPLLFGILAVAVVLRVTWLTADPPSAPSVGIVWHDEGAWVHNARNKALFGSWRLDDWNPAFIAPVFTGIEYGSFKAFGVGTWQARLVSVVAGVLSVGLLAAGVRRVAGSAACLIAAALLATNFTYVMYDRAAIMEGLMTAFIVASWYCSARADERPAWGAGASLMATLAYFTKASAAFYVAALGLAALWSLLRPRALEAGRRERQATVWTLAGLGVCFGLAAALFVVPHWPAYRFYNWQMSVTRKPSYTLKALIDRASWFPVLHDTFTRMWFELLLATMGAWGVLLRWKASRPAERLLLLWVAVGSAELLIHDAGNERRFVMLIPAIVALASVVLARGEGLLPAEARGVSRVRIWLFSPLVLYSAYVVSGPMARLPFFYAVGPSVHLAGAIGAVTGLLVLAFWPRVASTLSRATWPVAPAATIAVLLAGGHVVEFGQWAAGRTYKNYEASLAVGRALPPGTLVQGKLANGLALENRIRPIFIGHGFGNFADRKHRADVRYILTYTAPSLGYEGSQILDVLDAYPGWHIIMNFDVAETPSGHDRAALIEKRAHD